MSVEKETAVLQEEISVFGDEEGIDFSQDQEFKNKAKHEISSTDQEHQNEAKDNDIQKTEQLNEIVVEDDDDPFRNVQTGLEGKYKQLLIDFWQNIIDDMESLNDNILIFQNEQFLSKFNKLASNEEDEEEAEEEEEEEPEAMDVDTDRIYALPPVNKEQTIQEQVSFNKHSDYEPDLEIAYHDSLETAKTDVENQVGHEDIFREDIKGYTGGKSFINYHIHNQLAEIMKQEKDAMQQLAKIIYGSKEGEQEGDPFRHNKLPLARIKKLMKFDTNLKMISSETPVVFSNICEIFIQELTLRAWSIVDSDKRRTIQKQDVLNALMKSDMYDFLIDITPRS
ncbi:hypothetical protein QEN19_003174 [Hanseniaspora menglaensis]